MNRKVLLGILAGVASVIALNALVASLVEANGQHARDHVASAQGAVPLLPAMALILWALPGTRRGWQVMTILAAIVIGGGVITVVGNLDVVDAMAGQSWTDAEAQELGPSRPGFEDGHDLAATGARVVGAAAIAVALVLVISRAVSWPVAVGSVVLTVLWPPYLAPGFGLTVVGTALLLAKNRELRSSRRQSEPSPSSTPTADRQPH